MQRRGSVILVRTKATFTHPRSKFMSVHFSKGVMYPVQMADVKGNKALTDGSFEFPNSSPTAAVILDEDDLFHA